MYVISSEISTRENSNLIPPQEQEVVVFGSLSLHQQAERAGGRMEARRAKTRQRRGLVHDSRPRRGPLDIGSLERL